MDLWHPRKCQKAKGFFIEKELTDHGKYVRTEHGDVFFARKEDAQKQCDIRNELQRISTEKRKKERRAQWKASHG